MEQKQQLDEDSFRNFSEGEIIINYDSILGRFKTNHCPDQFGEPQHTEFVFEHLEKEYTLTELIKLTIEYTFELEIAFNFSHSCADMIRLNVDGHTDAYSDMRVDNIDKIITLSGTIIVNDGGWFGSNTQLQTIENYLEEAVDGYGDTETNDTIPEETTDSTDIDTQESSIDNTVEELNTKLQQINEQRVGKYTYAEIVSVEPSVKNDKIDVCMDTPRGIYRERFDVPYGQYDPFELFCDHYGLEIDQWDELEGKEVKLCYENDTWNLAENYDYIYEMKDKIEEERKESEKPSPYQKYYDGAFSALWTVLWPLGYALDKRAYGKEDGVRTYVREKSKSDTGLYITGMSLYTLGWLFLVGVPLGVLTWL